MIRPRSLICLLAAGVLALSAGDAHASFINAVFVSGAGGSATNNIDNSNPSAPTDYFVATFTSIAPIDFTVTINTPGNFYLSFTSPPGSVANNTGVTIDALEFQLLSPPAGAFLLGAQQQSGTPLPILTLPGSYAAEISGPTNLAAGASTAFGIGFNIPNGTGPQTVTVALTPFAVPEPMSIVMTGLGVLGLAGFGPRRHGSIEPRGPPFPPDPGPRPVPGRAAGP